MNELGFTAPVRFMERQATAARASQLWLRTHQSL
jgi:hypothetical protein